MRGVLEDGDHIETRRRCWEKPCWLLGRRSIAHPAASLWVDAQAIGEGTRESRKPFGKVPPAIEHRQPTARLRISEQTKRGVPGAFLGSGQGIKTDEELLAMLRDVRG